jgi:hypothetical protein
MEGELWKILSALITVIDRRFPIGDKHHSVGRIVRMFLWAALHDRPVYWACDRRNWRGFKPPPRLPDQSTMSRRLRREETWRFLEMLIEALGDDDRGSLLRYLDGKPLPVSRHSRDRDAKFGRGAGGKDRGYKIHAIYAGKNRPIAWSVTPMNRCEHHEGAALIDDRLGEGYLLADANYDANHLHEHAGEHGVRLLTPRRYAQAKGRGHHRHSAYRIEALDRLAAPSPFTRHLLAERRAIETRFAHLTNFGGGLTCLPPWVRGLHRVRLWVAAKFIVRLARDQCLRTGVA